MNFSIAFFLVIATYIHFLLGKIRDINEDTHDLFWILSVCFFTEIISKIFTYNDMPLWHLYNFSFIIHNAYWLKIILRGKNSKQKIIIGSYVIFSIITLFFINKISFFNKTIMIVGSLMYLISFIILSYKNLKSENIDFFKSNHFILISSPIIFFFGLSILFGFNSEKLIGTRVFGDTNLYRFIIIFVNIIYYSLLNIYIIKEKRDYA